MTRQALALSLPAILHGLDTFEETLHKMRYRKPPGPSWRMALVRLCSPELDTSPEALLPAAGGPENGAPRYAAPAPEAPPAQAPAAPPPQERPPVPEPPLEKEAPFLEEAPRPSPLPPAAEKKPRPSQKGPGSGRGRPVGRGPAVMDWPEILQRIRSDTKRLAMAFAGSCAYVNGDYMLIDAPELAFELLENAGTAGPDAGGHPPGDGPGVPGWPLPQGRSPRGVPGRPPEGAGAPGPGGGRALPGGGRPDPGEDPDQVEIPF